MTELAGALIGLLAGIASGVAGVGGGVVMVPAMTEFLDLPQQMAQGTSLLAIIFTSVAGTTVNVRNKRVDLKSAVVIGLAGIVAVQLGSRLALRLDQNLMRRLFGVFVLVSALRMFYRLSRSRRGTNSGVDQTSDGGTSTSSVS